MHHVWTQNSHFGPFHLPRGLILVTFRSQNVIFRSNPGPFLVKIDLFGLRGLILGPILEQFWPKRVNFRPKYPKITLFAAERVPKGDQKDPERNPLGLFWTILAPFELKRVLFDPKGTFLYQNPLQKLPFWLHFRCHLGSQNDPLGPSLAGWPPSRWSSSSSSSSLAGGFRVHRNYVKMQLKSSRA